MIKAIFFDFDGVLIDLPEAHFNTLNQAIKEVAGDQFVISEKDHISTFNGLSTKTKLKMLANDRGLDLSLVDRINEKKQEYTLKYIDENIKENIRLKEDLEKLKNDGFIIYCVSNAIRHTVDLGLEKLGILYLFDCVIGNDDFNIKQKPAPDCWLNAMMLAKVDPKEVLIVEDSKNGRESAVRSGANVCTVDCPNDMTYEHINKNIIKYKSSHSTYKWVDSKLNIVLPMSGKGQRFIDAGVKLPKPLIPVFGIQMIQIVIDNINVQANYIFVVQNQHCELYNLDLMLLVSLLYNITFLLYNHIL
jgi:HAD superfamily hydrolase (TIGR01509 family)